MARLNCILSIEGADARTSRKIYFVVVQLFMMYGSETWVLTPYTKSVLGGFHHRVDRRLTGWKLQKGRDGGWVYPPLKFVMAWAGL